MITNQEEEINNNITLVDIAKEIEEMRYRFRTQTALLTTLEYEVKGLREEVRRFKETQPFVLKGGRFPTEFDKIEFQIFHRTDLTQKEIKSGKAPWSCKLTFWQGERKADKDIALLDHEKFKQSATNVHDKSIQQIAEQLDVNWIGGMNRERTVGKGTPYIPTEHVLVANYETNPSAGIMIGTKSYIIRNFRPGKGNKAGHAMWYGVHVVKS